MQEESHSSRPRACPRSCEVSVFFPKQSDDDETAARGFLLPSSIPADEQTSALIQSGRGLLPKSRELRARDDRSPLISARCSASSATTLQLWMPPPVLAPWRNRAPGYVSSLEFSWRDGGGDSQYNLGREHVGKWSCVQDAKSKSRTPLSPWRPWRGQRCVGSKQEVPHCFPGLLQLVIPDHGLKAFSLSGLRFFRSCPPLEDPLKLALVLGNRALFRAVTLAFDGFSCNPGKRLDGVAWR